jgi:hypothetical protein
MKDNKEQNRAAARHKEESKIGKKHNQHMTQKREYTERSRKQSSQEK